ncbi:MAG: hypothetical protein ABFR82_07615 [Nitrospirota bacterium]
MSTCNTYNIIIASSEDIVTERKTVHEICWGLNKGILPNHHKVSFQIKEWEKVFSSALSPRDIIKSLTDECDILILIFHKKFAVPSASLEQFLETYDQWKSLKKPDILSFFRTAKISTLKELKNPQLLKVFELKEKIDHNSTMICESFSAPNEFCEKVQDTLDIWISKKAENQ